MPGAMNGAPGATPQRVRMGPLIVTVLVLVLNVVNAVVIWVWFRIADVDTSFRVSVTWDAPTLPLWVGTIGAAVFLVAAWWTGRARRRRWLMAAATLAAALPLAMWLVPTLVELWSLVRAVSDTASAG
jgi:hypothetical protein